MEVFDEKVFIWALCHRVEEVKKFAGFFSSDWLRTAELQPVFNYIVKFTKTHGEPPGFTTLKDLISRDLGEEVYESRYKPILNEVEKGTSDSSFVVHTLKLAQEAAMTRSFDEMTRSQKFMKMIADSDGRGIGQDIDKWRLSFLGKQEDLHMPFLDAVQKLKESREFLSSNFRVECGIPMVDKWCGGGMRSKNLGIWMAPTGHGKTAVMVFTSHHMAIQDEKKVWFISNELEMDQITERFLSRMTGVSLDKIMDDPATAISSPGLRFVKHQNLHKNLMLSYINRDASMDEIESELSRFESLWDWRPQVIVIDYMERMKPNASGFRRDNSWIYFGEIAKDMSRVAKRRDCVIWSAIQTNRAGLGAKELLSSMAQGSIQHLQEATNLIAMHQPVDAEEGDQVMEFKCLKARESKINNSSVKLVANLDTQTITHEVWEAPVDVDRGDDDVPDAGTWKKKSKFQP